MGREASAPQVLRVAHDDVDSAVRWDADDTDDVGNSRPPGGVRGRNFERNVCIPNVFFDEGMIFGAPDMFGVHFLMKGRYFRRIV